MSVSLAELPGPGMLVVELQNDLCAPSLCDERGLRGALARAVRDRDVLARTRTALERMRARGIPVLYATKERHPGERLPDHAPIYRGAASSEMLLHGTWGAQIVDEVAPQPGDLVLPRFTGIDPSVGAGLWETLEHLGIETLIVAGISTTLAVEGTVRAAVNRRIRVVVLEDLCASVPEGWHRFSVEHILPLLATVTTSEALT